MHANHRPASELISTKLVCVISLIFFICKEIRLKSLQLTDVYVVIVLDVCAVQPLKPINRWNW